MRMKEDGKDCPWGAEWLSIYKFILSHPLLLGSLPER